MATPLDTHMTLYRSVVQVTFVITQQRTDMMLHKHTGSELHPLTHTLIHTRAHPHTNNNCLNELNPDYTIINWKIENTLIDL